MHITTKSGRIVQMPDEQEAARIDAGIVADPDNPELDDEGFARAKSVQEVFGPEIAARLIALKRPRGRPAGSVAAITKAKVSLRLDPDVLEALRATGSGWQGRVNQTLRQAFVKR